MKDYQPVFRERESFSSLTGNLFGETKPPFTLSKLSRLSDQQEVDWLYCVRPTQQLPSRPDLGSSTSTSTAPRPRPGHSQGEQHTVPRLEKISDPNPKNIWSFPLSVSSKVSVCLNYLCVFTQNIHSLCNISNWILRI